MSTTSASSARLNFSTTSCGILKTLLRTPDFTGCQEIRRTRTPDAALRTSEFAVAALRR
jgi:hypothetical protein